MITKRELDGAIAECENAPASYQICEKLATFYTIREHAYKEEVTDVEHSYDGRPARTTTTPRLGATCVSAPSRISS